MNITIFIQKYYTHVIKSGIEIASMWSSLLQTGKILPGNPAIKRKNNLRSLK